MTNMLLMNGWGLYRWDVLFYKLFYELVKTPIN